MKVCQIPNILVRLKTIAQSILFRRTKGHQLLEKDNQKRERS
jgi:hypothetical protein